MNRNALLFAISGILLLGAGCENTTETPIAVQTKPAEVTSTSTTPTATTSPAVATSTPENTTPVSADSITLVGKALGNRMVQFNWTLPEGAKNPRSFHLIRGQNENPTQPPGFWYKQDGKSRSSVWVKLPKGEQHFRICTWETTKCEVYSNDVMVNVE
jgi:hypothetical protein